MRYIRTWTFGDAEDLARAINNKKVQDNLRDGLPYPYTKRDAAEYIEKMLGAPKDTQYCWAVQREGRAVGSIGIFRGGNIHRRTGEMEYYIAEPYWGQGLATGAIKEACAFVFEHTDILRIFAEPFAHNVASCKALEKAGFALEGIMKSNAVKNGEIVDMRLYALVR